ncbi:hypothetical protein SE16_02050 [Ardenticatena maritima]|uniref:Uncharacterized protein n=1 Tax=Ardenticatena maritima TaxID=872965 RepID=A0A0P6YG08_9CHLR|nr:hypothetical protein SE16_02050 [Ardenticatena maritima]
MGRSRFLSPNFPVIDRFENGVATSIKSLDLNAATYQNPTRLASTVMRYVRTLAQWEGQAEAWGQIQIAPSQINEIWKQIQDAGTHMGFMDYADPQYDDLMWRLQQQMLTLVELIRRNS